MNFFLLFFVAAIGVLLALLIWSLRGPLGTGDRMLGSSSLEEIGRKHVVFFPQIRQALAPQDFAFLAAHGSNKLARRVRRERRSVALAHLAALKEDFHKLLKLARVVALLSPKVMPLQEYEQFRLSLLFSVQCEWVRLKLLLGIAPLEPLSELSGLLSGLAVRLETAITELGERAALASELASSLDGSRVNLS